MSLVYAIRLWLVITITLNATSLYGQWQSSYSKNDPFPIFSTLDPHIFLYMQEKDRLKNISVDTDTTPWFSFSISPFGQNATTGRTDKREELYAFYTTTSGENSARTEQLAEQPYECCVNNCEAKCANIGDLNGRWNMLAMLFGDHPENTPWPETLDNARQQIFMVGPDEVIQNPSYHVDRNQEFGFFTIPIEYRKRGVRFEVQANIINDFGLALQTGVADICQTVQRFSNLTCEADPSCVCSCGSILYDAKNKETATFMGRTYTENEDLTNCLLMEKLKDIACESNLGIHNFHDVSLEDIRLSLYWRHAYAINNDRDPESWARFLIIPYAVLGGSIAVSDDIYPNNMFDVSFGNNGHSAVSATTGLNIDFTETIEIGCEAGLTHFFEKDFCNFPMPTHPCQSGIYPFQTSVRREPGHNWHFCAKLFAHHFLDRLSFYGQWVIVTHRSDCFKLLCPDPAFCPQLLTSISSWRSQVFNSGFTYDISPNISLGFLWQAPVSQRNTYRSTTVMFSFNAII